MTRWKFSELNGLCKAKGIPDAKLYQTDLNWRWKRAEYHAKTAARIWSDHFKGYFSIPDERNDKPFFSYEAQVESCAQSLHALANVFLKKNSKVKKEQDMEKISFVTWLGRLSRNMAAGFPIGNYTFVFNFIRLFQL